MNRMEAICRDEGIDADFARPDGFLFAAEEDHRAELDEEYRACRELGVDVEWVDRAPVPAVDTGKALRFPHQRAFIPPSIWRGSRAQSSLAVDGSTPTSRMCRTRKAIASSSSRQNRGVWFERLAPCLRPTLR